MCFFRVGGESVLMVDGWENDEFVFLSIRKEERIRRRRKF